MTTQPSLGADRRAGLLAVKLGALVRDHLGDAERAPASFSGGAALVDAERRAWILLDNPAVGVGACMAWAAKHDVARLDVLVDAGPGAGAAARRAAYFASPPTVWAVEGRALVPAAVEALVPHDPAPAEALAAAAPLAEAGVEMVVEHGVVLGEILGLEVARVVPAEGGGWRLEVGVGRFDREAFTALEGVRTTEEALATTVAVVREHRRPEARPHLLNRLARERWLRADALADPARVGAVRLAPIGGPTPRASLNEASPAFALGADSQDRALVVGFGVGVDLELAPDTADAAALASPGARLVLATPSRDRYPALEAVAAALAAPAEVVTVEGSWPA
ncbi:MAG: hypothetical protein ACKVWR_16795 [Acidimicrobiales bacterium]